MATQPRIDRTEIIACLNDRARQGLDPTARILTTRTCLAAFCDLDNFIEKMLTQAGLMRAVRQCTFSDDSPERDFASFSFKDRIVWMKIDYYDADMTYGSGDPADASLTTRVLTILLPEDY
jgi:hypothetical protein